jgi:3-oxoacyl-[acyl-carrier protein] reductase
MSHPTGVGAPPALPGIEGRAALVTGGSRGIGRAVAVMLSAHGAHVGIGYRSDAAAAEETLREMREVASRSGPRPDPWAQAADLSDERGVAKLFSRVDELTGGEIAIFVANAGIWNEEPRPVEDLSAAEWRAMLDTNLTSAFLTTREAARRMGDGGRIVLITSTAAQRGEPGHAHYAASKGALQSFVKSLAVELGGRGITVNAVAPGWVDTDMSAGVLRGAVRERVLAEIPVGRIAAPEDVAGPVAFLVSDLARHITGEILNVNGGGVLCG